MEENDNDTTGDDLTTSLKPEIDLENKKSYADVKACNSVSQTLPKRLLHKRQ